MKLSEIIGALPKLDQHELVLLRAALNQLIRVDGEAPDETSPLYDCMASLLGVGLSFRDFHNVNAYRSWRKAAPAVVLFIEQSFPEATKVAKMAVMRFLLEALRDDLLERGVPITIGTMSSNLDRLPEVFDASFPMYREAGMAHLVLKQMERK